MLLQVRKKGITALAGAGSKIMDEDIEEALFDWIVEMTTNNLRVSQTTIQGKARYLSTVQGFKPAGGGWSDF